MFVLSQFIQYTNFVCHCESGVRLHRLADEFISKVYFNTLEDARILHNFWYWLSPECICLRLDFSQAKRTCLKWCGSGLFSVGSYLTVIESPLRS